MVPISFTSRADGTCEIDDPTAYAVTAANPVLLKILVLSFWEMGGPPAVPSRLVEQLGELARIDTDAAEMQSALAEQSRRLTNLINVWVAEGLIQPNEPPRAPAGLSEVPRHD